MAACDLSVNAESSGNAPLTRTSSSGAEGRLPMAQGCVWGEDRRGLWQELFRDWRAAVWEHRGVEKSQLNVLQGDYTDPPNVVLPVGMLRWY